MRKCCECPARTVAVCRHAFGKLWCVKSHDGTGCTCDLDETAKAWYAAGWKPADAASELPPMPKRPVRQQVQASLPIRPTRPKTRKEYY